MQMPGRFMTDTSNHCILTSASVMMAKAFNVHDVLPNGWAATSWPGYIYPGSTSPLHYTHTDTNANQMTYPLGYGYAGVSAAYAVQLDSFPNVTDRTCA